LRRAVKDSSKIDLPRKYNGLPLYIMGEEREEEKEAPSQ
jgi:hypothetical protein